MVPRPRTVNLYLQGSWYYKLLTYNTYVLSSCGIPCIVIVQIINMNAVLQHKHTPRQEVVEEELKGHRIFIVNEGHRIFIVNEVK